MKYVIPFFVSSNWILKQWSTNLTIWCIQSNANANLCVSVRLAYCGIFPWMKFRAWSSSFNKGEGCRLLFGFVILIKAMYPYLPLEIVTDSSGNQTSFSPLSAFYLGEHLTSNFACPKIQDSFIVILNLMSWIWFYLKLSELTH